MAGFLTLSAASTTGLLGVDGGHSRHGRGAVDVDAVALLGQTLAALSFTTCFYVLSRLFGFRAGNDLPARD